MARAAFGLQHARPEGEPRGEARLVDKAGGREAGVRELLARAHALARVSDLDTGALAHILVAEAHA
eukprot:14213214-Alexandrium_andersonii.AAC.1